MAYNQIDVQQEYEAERIKQQMLADQLRQQSQQGQQQPQGGMNPMQGMNVAKQFMGGGETAAAGGESAGSSAGLMNPWTGLAAVVIGNEREGVRGGYRDEDPMEYGKDLLTGSVAQQDISQRWSPKIFGKDDKYGLGGDADMASEFASGDISSGFKKMKNTSLGKALRKIF